MPYIYYTHSLPTYLTTLDTLGYSVINVNMKVRKKIKKEKKDNSTKNDYFIYCRNDKCGQYIRPDWRSSFDKRYCKDCV